MTAHAPARTPFPIRGTPGGWRDSWDDPDDAAVVRARALEVERLSADRTKAIAQQLREEREEEDDEAA